MAAGAQAFVVFANGYTQSRRINLVQESLVRKVPGIYYDGEFVENGGFMSYATSSDIHRQIAAVVDRILKGANPANIPIEQPTSIELLINLKTAKAMGISVPNSLQLRADRMY